MKKVLIGCGIVALVLFLIAVGLGIFVVAKLNSIGNRYQTAVSEVNALDAKYAYTPPADESLDEQRLSDYFAVREAVLTKAQSNPTIQKIMNTPQGQDPNIGLGEIVALGTSFGPELISTYAAELDAHQMSPNEYRDTAERIYATVRSGADNGHQDMTEIYESLNRVIEEMNIQLAKSNNSQHQVDFEDKTSDFLAAHPVPESNYEILAQYKDELTKDPFVAFLELFGLAQIDQHAGVQTGSAPQPTTVGEPATN